MSRISDCVIEAQEFACEHYNLSRESFVALAHANYGGLLPGSTRVGLNPVRGYNPLTRDAAIEAFDEIQNDLADYDRDYVPAVVDADGIPF